ncbi:MAG: hypothetical protein R6V62_11300 [Candidatus Fermentibacteraceae bacterium]
MKAVLSVMLLTSCAAVFGQSEEELAVQTTVESFFAALQEARGEDAAALYSETAMLQVDLTFQSIREGIRRNDESVLLRLRTAGYQAESGDIRDWTTVEYLTQTIELPMMFGRYTPFTMTVDSIRVQGRRAEAFLTFENTAGIQMGQQAVFVQEDDLWLAESFMGMTSFP